MKAIHFIALFVSAAVLTSCVSPQYSYNNGFEEDDVYFSDSDPEEYNYSSYVNDRSAEDDSVDDYNYQDDYYSDDYESEEYNDGGDTYITHNYYGNNWNPGFNRPWGMRPNNGWYMGWNSWNGWYGGFNYNWGYSAFGWNTWNNPYWGWYDPWYDPWGPNWGYGGYCYNPWGPNWGWGYNPYSPYGWGWNNPGIYSEVWANNGFGSGIHYGHRPSLSSGSNITSAYTGGTAYEQDKLTKEISTPKVSPEKGEAPGISTSKGDPFTPSAKPETDVAAVAQKERNTGSDNKPSIVLNRPADVLASSSNELGNSRPAKENPSSNFSSRPAVNEDYFWTAPNNRPEKDSRDDYFSSPNRQDSFMDRNKPRNNNQPSWNNNRPDNNRPAKQRDNNSFDPGKWNKPSNNNRPSRDNSRSSFGNQSRSNTSINRSRSSGSSPSRSSGSSSKSTTRRR